jgi:hypothetical protein
VRIKVLKIFFIKIKAIYELLYNSNFLLSWIPVWIPIIIVYSIIILLLIIYTIFCTVSDRELNFLKPNLMFGFIFVKTFLKFKSWNLTFFKFDLIESSKEDLELCEFYRRNFFQFEFTFNKWVKNIFPQIKR